MDTRSVAFFGMMVTLALACLAGAFTVPKIPPIRAITLAIIPSCVITLLTTAYLDLDADSSMVMMLACSLVFFLTFWNRSGSKSVRSPPFKDFQQRNSGGYILAILLTLFFGCIAPRTENNEPLKVYTAKWANEHPIPCQNFTQGVRTESPIVVVKAIGTVHLRVTTRLFGGEKVCLDRVDKIGPTGKQYSLHSQDLQKGRYQVSLTWEGNNHQYTWFVVHPRR